MTIQACIIVAQRRELARARRAFKFASVIAGVLSIVAAWGWLR